MVESIHVGIIPDGNRRWCKKNNYHLDDMCKKWIEIVSVVIEELLHILNNGNNRSKTKYKDLMNINELSLYVCSIDNMSRNDGSIETICNFIRKLEEIYTNNMNNLCAENKDKVTQKINKTKINIIGEVDLLPSDIQEICDKLSEERDANPEFTINVAIAYDYKKDLSNYGIFNDVKYNREQSDIDLIVRTGGEKRISGFFPSKTIYSEFFFKNKLWPEFRLQDLNNIVKLYKKRERRFGK